MILGSRRGERREREEDNEVEVNDITVHFKGDGRREEESGVRRKGAGKGEGPGGSWRVGELKFCQKYEPLGRNSTSGVENATP